MGLFTGKKGVIMGVANDHSIAWHIAKKLHDEGAELAFNHLPDKDDRKKMERRVRKVAETVDAKLIMPCEVTDDASIDAFFDGVKNTFGKIDFLVHSIAFAPLEDIRCATIDCSRDGFKLAMDISAYSLIATGKRAAPLMTDGGSILGMCYYGGEKVVAGYNMMGVCKAALDAVIRYMAYDLGDKAIRVNGVSAGPMRTLAASAVGDFSKMLAMYSAISPLGRNITGDEVANAAAFLLGDMSTGTTGEILHVDSGYNIMGNPGRAADAFKATLG